MKDKRTIALMAVLLLLLLAGLALRSQIESHFLRTRAEPPVAQVLPGENKISNVQVRATKSGYTVHVEYFYRGDKGTQALLSARPVVEGQPPEAYYAIRNKFIKAGAGAVDIDLERPSMPTEPVVTRKILVAMGTAPVYLARQEVEQIIEWPDARQYALARYIATKPPEQLYKEAVTLIDSGDVRAARKMLEQILLSEPGNAPAQIEMARVAMKENWGPEGLGQAEKYLVTVSVQTRAT